MRLWEVPQENVVIGFWEASAIPALEPTRHRCEVSKFGMQLAKDYIRIRDITLRQEKREVVVRGKYVATAVKNACRKGRSRYAKS